MTVSLKCWQHWCCTVFKTVDLNPQREVVQCPTCGSPLDIVEAIKRARPDYEDKDR
jgi:hypothetical protein